MSIHDAIVAAEKNSSGSLPRDQIIKAAFESAFEKASCNAALMHIFRKPGIQGAFNQPAHVPLITHFMSRALGLEPDELTNSIDSFYAEVAAQNGKSVDPDLVQQTIGEALEKLVPKAP